ncbi:MAG: RnfABCDGE type electron transport complex subunit G [Mediterranea sp.]|jgi:electron transport complex protein RnfG|nr:RnfABCDGE type electron transport complex subunit G [Mediterranea sp.]
MKKLGSSLKNMLLVLTGVTVIAVGLLAYVNELTKEPIATANMKALNDALERVVPEFDNNPVEECDTIFEEKNGRQLVQYIIYPAKSGGQLVGTAVQATSLGFGGEIKLLVGFDAAGKIHDYALLAHAETPGLGSKADVWFKKGSRGEIVGMHPGEAPLVVKNDGGQIDAITASTITTRAFLNAVNAAYAAYNGNPDGFTSASRQVDTDTNTSATTKVESTDSINAN